MKRSRTQTGHVTYHGLLVQQHFKRPDYFRLVWGVTGVPLRVFNQVTANYRGKISIVSIPIKDFTSAFFSAICRSVSAASDCLVLVLGLTGTCA